MWVLCGVNIHNKNKLQICAETIATNPGVFFEYPMHTMDSYLLNSNNFTQWSLIHHSKDKGSIHTDMPSSFIDKFEELKNKKFMSTATVCELVGNGMRPYLCVSACCKWRRFCPTNKSPRAFDVFMTSKRNPELIS